MKHLLLCICALVITTALNAQSKKELLAQVERLKSENESLKSQNAELQKPKTVVLSDEAKRASYGFGVLMGSNMKRQPVDSLDIESILAGFKDAFAGDTTQMSQEECMTTVQTFMQRAMDRKSEEARAGNTAFLTENKKRPQVKETATGLQYEVVKAGTGKSPGPNDKVTVHYTGKLLDGTVFDSSVERGQPATFGVTQVIPGWTEALQLMKEGDKVILYIPDNLAYGERGAGSGIPPFSLLIFEVELLKIN